jgi:hypothetical protein
VAGGKNQHQQVVADGGGGLGLSLDLQLPAQFGILARQRLAPAQQVDGAPLCGGHEPGARVLRDARLGPPLQGNHQCVLCEVLSQTDVTHHSGQSGDQAG